MQDGELTGVDGGLAEKPQRPGECGLLPQAGVVVEVGVDAVDGRVDTGRPEAMTRWERT